MKGLEDFEADCFYHIVNHAVGNENLFRNDDNFLYFLSRYEHHTAGVFDTYAYCLMPNHFHLLVRVKSFDDLKSHPQFNGDVHKLVMQRLSNMLNGYAKAYNIRFERKGALFIDYTKRFRVDTDSYFTAAIAYIHQNPVHHGFVKDKADWRFSSYLAYLSDKNTKLKRKEVLEWFGNIEAYLQFHKNQLPFNPEIEF